MISVITILAVAGIWFKISPFLPKLQQLEIFCNSSVILILAELTILLRKFQRPIGITSSWFAKQNDEEIFKLYHYLTQPFFVKPRHLAAVSCLIILIRYHLAYIQKQHLCLFSTHTQYQIELINICYTNS